MPNLQHLHQLQLGLRSDFPLRPHRVLGIPLESRTDGGHQGSILYTDEYSVGLAGSVQPESMQTALGCAEPSLTFGLCWRVELRAGEGSLWAPDRLEPGQTSRRRYMDEGLVLPLIHRVLTRSLPRTFCLEL